MTVDPFGLPDLARRDLGGAVVAANDEFFAAKENLIVPGPAQARVEFGHRGHSLTIDHGWREIATSCLAWLDAQEL